MTSDTAAAFSLLAASAVRSRAHQLLALGLEGRLPHSQVEMKRLDAVADRVIAVTRAAYPRLDVPFHSRWRHFVYKGNDRFAALAAKAHVLPVTMVIEEKDAVSALLARALT